ncbi:hypothetical protein MSG28_002653 [Choristoneura fumiferana]|uniref:Uncharacterized protein n=1 Tax=Choristoneura fumiferana TaxID=7141 RepID=A0ACC0JIJ9_CHOFU|nr:hypothetical protein MSG28_002653 [Choristoneura fumiferana]
MVSLGVVLVTVTSLAINISNAISAEPFVHHACEGKTLCHIKPDNYPQEKIDRLVIKNLPHLHRMKRSAPALPPPLSSEGNCAIKPIEMKSPFIVDTDMKKRAPYFIVQSAWFHQEIPVVSCRDNKPGEKTECFQGVSNKPSYCKTKTATSLITIYDHVSNKLNNIPINIDIDCVCEVEKN